MKFYKLQSQFIYKLYNKDDNVFYYHYDLKISNEKNRNTEPIVEYRNNLLRSNNDIKSIIDDLNIESIKNKSTESVDTESIESVEPIYTESIDTEERIDKNNVKIKVKDIVKFKINNNEFFGEIIEFINDSENNKNMVNLKINESKNLLIEINKVEKENLNKINKINKIYGNNFDLDFGNFINNTVINEKNKNNINSRNSLINCSLEDKQKLFKILLIILKKLNFVRINEYVQNQVNINKFFLTKEDFNKYSSEQDKFILKDKFRHGVVIYNLNYKLNKFAFVEFFTFYLLENNEQDNILIYNEIYKDFNLKLLLNNKNNDNYLSLYEKEKNKYVLTEEDKLNNNNIINKNYIYNESLLQKHYNFKINNIKFFVISVFKYKNEYTKNLDIKCIFLISKTEENLLNEFLIYKDANDDLDRYKLFIGNFEVKFIINWNLINQYNEYYKDGEQTIINKNQSYSNFVFMNAFQINLELENEINKVSIDFINETIYNFDIKKIETFGSKDYFFKKFDLNKKIRNINSFYYIGKYLLDYINNTKIYTTEKLLENISNNAHFISDDKLNILVDFTSISIFNNKIMLYILVNSLNFFDSYGMTFYNEDVESFKNIKKIGSRIKNNYIYKKIKNNFIINPIKEKILVIFKNIAFTHFDINQETPFLSALIEMLGNEENISEFYLDKYNLRLHPGFLDEIIRIINILWKYIILIIIKEINNFMLENYEIISNENILVGHDYIFKIKIKNKINENFIYQIYLKKNYQGLYFPIDINFENNINFLGINKKIIDFNIYKYNHINKKEVIFNESQINNRDFLLYQNLIWPSPNYNNLDTNLKNTENEINSFDNE